MLSKACGLPVKGSNTTYIKKIKVVARGGTTDTQTYSTHHYKYAIRKEYIPFYLQMEVQLGHHPQELP